MDLSSNFIISLVIAIPIALIFFLYQLKFHSTTKKNLQLFKDFFKKSCDYETIDIDDNATENRSFSSKYLKNVAVDGAELKGLIIDINEYLESCKGTATFNIIQNKTERRITKLYDRAESKAALPTHLGLMGTFVGVFLGLGAFLYISMKSPDGITDDAIHSLILGVLVSMSTSFIGLLMSTNAHDAISDAKNKNDDDKNEFYEYIQNKLMPSVDVSLTEALGNLHQTVSEFEPSFTHVIDGFKETFQECTNAFGVDFRTSVQNMVGAVGIMSGNINQISENVHLLENLLTRVSGAEWVRYMHQFAETSDRFEELTHSLNDFERARRMMLAAVQESINLQKSYSESLAIPREVAIQINTILQRVVRFANNINDLGDNLNTIQMFGNAQMDEIRNQIAAINAKQNVAKEYAETANEDLKHFFDGQIDELSRLENDYKDALENLFVTYENNITQHIEEINQRHELFKEAIDEKFELQEVRAELGQLNKIPSVESKIDDVKSAQRKLQQTSEEIRSKLNTMNGKKEKEKKGSKTTNSDNTENSRKVERQGTAIEPSEKIQGNPTTKDEKEKREKLLREREEAISEMMRKASEKANLNSPRTSNVQIEEQETGQNEQPAQEEKSRWSFFKSIFGRNK